MKEKLTELLKYPTICLSLLITLYFAQKLLNIDFSKIDSIGAEGIKFQVYQSNSAIETRLNSLEQKMEGLTKLLGEKKFIDTVAFQKDISKESVVNQVISDVTASLASNGTSNEGYIFIGNYKNGKWPSIVLYDLNSQKSFSGDPTTLRLNDPIYTVYGNMTLRKSLPHVDDNPDYFKNTDAIGVVLKNSKIRIIDRPNSFKLNSGLIKVWAKIKIEN